EAQDSSLFDAAPLPNHRHRHVGREAARVHPTDSQPTHVVVVVQVVDQKLEPFALTRGGRWDVLQYRLEQRLKILAGLLEARGSDSLSGYPVEDPELQLLIVAPPVPFAGINRLPNLFPPPPPS